MIFGGVSLLAALFAARWRTRVEIELWSLRGGGGGGGLEENRESLFSLFLLNSCQLF